MLRHRLRVIGLLVATSVLSSCSFAFVRGPGPVEQRSDPVECTSSSVAPLLDLAWVGYALAATSAEKNGGIGAEDIALSSIWVGSAAYGFVTMARCQSAKGAAARASDAAREAHELLLETPSHSEGRVPAP